MANYIGAQEITLHYQLRRKNGRGPAPADVLPILAIDPGGVTGWSLLVLKRFSNGTELLDTDHTRLLTSRVKWYHGQIDCRTDESAGVYQLKRMIDDWWYAAVVIESFFIRQRAVDLSPIRVISKIDDHLWGLNKKLHEQQASQAKTTATDERLKQWGAYTSAGGLQHARDADRHALLFMRRCIGTHGKSLRKIAWPHIFGV